MNIAVISDNTILVNRFRNLLVELNRSERFVFYATAPLACGDIKIIRIKDEWPSLCGYDLVISLHCKQLFPPALIAKVKCINVHPGLNPYNRGWFPQVFSILNKFPAGATIHEIDEQLDHGNIIDQQPVEICSDDTSLTAYEKILDAEMLLLRKNLDRIISGTFSSYPPAEEGNLNLKKDFDRLCEIDMDEKASYREVIDKLRALTHGEYKNAFYYENGKKIFVSVNFKRS